MIGETKVSKRGQPTDKELDIMTITKKIISEAKGQFGFKENSVNKLRSSSHTRKISKTS